MEDQPQPSIVQEPGPQPQVAAQPDQPANNEVPGKKNKATLFVIIGIVVLLVVFAAAIVMLNAGSSKDEATITSTTASTEVKNTADLDKISQELDTADLNSYDTDLQLNDNDAATF